MAVHDVHKSIGVAHPMMDYIANGRYANQALNTGLDGIDASAMKQPSVKAIDVTRETIALACMLSQRVEDLVNEIAGPSMTADGSKGDGANRIGPIGTLPELADQARQVEVIIRSA